MTDGGETTPPALVTAREAAREQARELREQHRRRDRRRRWLLRGGIVGAALVAGASVAAVLFFLPARSPAGPLNMQSDGIRIGAGGLAERGPAVPARGEPIPFPANPDEVLDIRVFVDYLSADSGAFEERNAESIRAWVEAGTATLEIHPIALLTTKSAGTQYSLRAANAAACVANYAPDGFLDFHAALLADQPAEGSEGLSDEELVERARKAVAAASSRPEPTPTPDPSATGPAATPAPTDAATDGPATGSGGPQAVPDAMPGIQRCIAELRFRAWVIAATDRAVSDPVPGTEVTAIATTPTVIVNGRPFGFDADSDAREFRQFVLQLAGEQYAEQATPTPTPVPDEEG